jgi:hypothetical protein
MYDNLGFMSYSNFMPIGLTSGFAPQDIDESREDIDESREDIDESLPIRRYYTGAQPVRSGIIRTNRGAAQFQVAQPYVKYNDFTTAMDKAYRHIVYIEKRLGSNVRRVNYSVQQMQNMSMITPMLGMLQPQPKLDSVNFVAGQGVPGDTDLKVQNSTMKPVDNTMMMMMMMMPFLMSSGSSSSGGVSSTGGSDMSMMMMMMFMFMSGSFGGTGTRP